jgi:hypothetical protein
MNPPDGRVYTARSDIYLGSFTFDAAGGEIKTHSQAGVRGQRFLFFDGRAASWPLVLSSYQDLSCETLRNVSLMVTQDAQDDSLSEGACPNPPPPPPRESTRRRGVKEVARPPPPHSVPSRQLSAPPRPAPGLAIPPGRYSADLRLAPSELPAQVPPRACAARAARAARRALRSTMVPAI